MSLSEDEEMQDIQNKWLNSTACTNSGSKVDSNRLCMGSFWGLFLITGTASLIAVIILFSLLLYYYMKDPNVKGNDNNELDDLSTGKCLKSLYSAMKSFIEYVDQKEGSTPDPRPRVSDSLRNSQWSTPVFTESVFVLGTSPFNTSFANTTISILDLEYVALQMKT